MDFHEMHNAYARATGQTPKTEATGTHIPTIVVKFSQTSEDGVLDAYSLVRRLIDQHTVRYDPICKEAAEAIEYVLERNRINLAKADEAFSVMADLYDSLYEIVNSGKDWPWEYAGTEDQKKIENALKGFNNYVTNHRPI